MANFMIITSSNSVEIAADNRYAAIAIGIKMVQNKDLFAVVDSKRGKCCIFKKAVFGRPDRPEVKIKKLPDATIKNVMDNYYSTRTEHEARRVRKTPCRT